MRIKNIETTNLDIMESISIQYKNISRFPANLHQILSRVCIFYQIDDVTPFELLALKKLGDVQDIQSNYVRGTSSETIQKFFNLTNFEGANVDLETLFTQLIGINDRMNDIGDEELQKINRVGPMGMQKYCVEFVLTGRSILSLQGYNFESIFQRESDEISYEESIEHHLIASLINAVYRALELELTSRDIFTDAWIYENIYKGSNFYQYRAISLFDDQGHNIKFVGNDEKGLMNEIQAAQSTNNKYNNRNWHFTVGCSTPISLFFYYLMMSIRDKNCPFTILDHEPFLNILAENTSFESMYITPEQNAESNMCFIANKYNDWFNDNIAEGKLDLFQRFYFLPANRTIQFTLLFDMNYGFEGIRYMKELQYHLKNNSKFNYTLEDGLVSFLETAFGMLSSYDILK